MYEPDDLQAPLTTWMGATDRTPLRPGSVPLSTRGGSSSSSYVSNGRGRWVTPSSYHYDPDVRAPAAPSAPPSAAQPVTHPVALVPKSSSQESGGNPRLAPLRQQLSDIQAQMMTNVTLVIDRGQSIDSLSSKANSMEHYSNEFLVASKRLKRKLLCQRIKCACLAALFLCVVVYCVMAAGCGGLSLPGCRST
jgi:hypothetical protein